MLKSFFRPASSIQRAVLGPLQTNCYFYMNNKHCLIIDPADNPKDIVRWINDDLKPNKVDIFLTHGHKDHTFGVVNFVKNLGEKSKALRIFASELDKDLFFQKDSTLASYYGIDVSLEPVSDKFVFVNEGDFIELGLQDDKNNAKNDVFKLNVFHIDGHTPGSVSLYSPDSKLLFSGDVLFLESIGNSPDNNHHLSMIENIKKKLFKLPPETIVLPGHGLTTTISHEMKYNPFLSSEY